MTHSVRRWGTVALGATMALATALPAAAVDRPIRSEGRAAGAEITLPGGTTLAGGLSTVNVSAERVLSEGIGATGLDPSISSAESTGTAVRDPESGENCATPALPAELSGLGISAACSTAAADAGDAPSGSATADLGTIQVDGSLLADVLLDAIAAPLVEQLNAATAQVTDETLAPVIAELATQCNAVVDQLPVDTSQLPDLPGLPGSPDLTPVLDEVADLTGDPCVVLTRLVAAPPVISDIDTARLIEELAAAFEGVDLLALELGSSSVASTTTDEVIETVTDATALRVSSASLVFLLPTVEALVDELVEPFLTELETALAPLGDSAPVIPTVRETVDAVLAALDIPLLDVDEPLLTIAGGDASATSRLDLASGTVETTSVPATVSITVSSALADLLGQEANVTVAPGQSETLFAGTPLESTIAVGASEDVQDEVDGIVGTGVRVSGVSITLFEGLEGGIGAAAGTVLTVAGAGPAPTTPVGTPELPTTGGGFAVLGVASIAGAAMLRRRTP